MSRSPHPMAARLKAFGKLVGPATVPGRLYNFGYYPAAASDQNTRRLIHGEVHRLASPASALRILDAYEGCAQSDPCPQLYRRELIIAQLFPNSHVEAWIYLINQTPERRVHIATGRHGSIEPRRQALRKVSPKRPLLGRS